MKKLSFIAAGALALATLSGSAVAASGPTKIGFSAEPYPPFSYKSPDGKWTGFELEMQRAVCKAASLDCQPTPTAWSGIIPALQIGKIDGIMNSMTITPERLKKIDFTHPYMVSKIDFVVPQGMKLASLDDLKGKVLGVQGATLAATYTNAHVRPLGIQVKVYNQQEQLTRDLEAGRVDAMIADSVYTKTFVLHHKDFKDVVAPGGPVQEIAIGVRKGDTALENKLNAGIETVLKDGTCKKLSMQFVHFDVCAQP
ncbi:MAG TPA: transporter substrate-binding domain-containing protein [Nevskiaceae bacterium]|nr:transporter substrate-binding domain-containing protein [Nevskiaceae bacterium]